MSIAPQVFHHVPKPVSFVEFLDAVRAATPRRFPESMGLNHRRVGLCISGGVDSMALAFLYNRLRATDVNLRIGDNLVSSKAIAYIIDHKLRPGSDKEAIAVVKAFGRFPLIHAQYAAINWRDELDMPPGTDVAALPGIESLARRFRYRRIAKQCGHSSVVSLFTAHHEDDQYETVLMRLLNGHGVRGLGGMRQGSNIPECSDLHGTYESGLVDDQLSQHPYITMYPPRRDWRFTRRELRREIDFDKHMAEFRGGLRAELATAYIDRHHYTDEMARRNRRPPPTAAPIETEDGGIVLYRPLLEFSKDRLIATCEANKIPWFEDSTNNDPTYTLRNAVRHMVKNHKLPVALQKESVLRLSRRCVEKAKAEDWEVERWMSKLTIHDFETLAGTLIVTVPDMGVPQPRRRSIYNSARRELRLSHRRTIAALMIRRLTDFVTPEWTPPQLSALQGSVSRIFPSLVPKDGEAPTSPPKAFNQASVLFIPLHPDSSKALAGANPLRSPAPNKWFLTRQPYPSRKPQPTKSWTTKPDPDSDSHFLEDPSLVADEEAAQNGGFWLEDWHSWRRWERFDGRFWFRLRARFKGALRVAPFSEEFAKEFRDGLDDEGRQKLTVLLRRYAPGKVRYTLPALYAVNPPPPEEYDVKKEEGHDTPEAATAKPVQGAEDGDGDERGPGEASGPPKPRLRESYAQTWVGRERDIKLLGLLTLPVHLPGLDKWVQWEVRYKKVDVALLDKTCPLEDYPGPPERKSPSTGLRWRLQRRKDMRRARGREQAVQEWDKAFDTHRYP